MHNINPALKNKNKTHLRRFHDFHNNVKSYRKDIRIFYDLSYVLYVNINLCEANGFELINNKIVIIIDFKSHRLV